MLRQPLLLQGGQVLVRRAVSVSVPVPLPLLRCASAASAAAVPVRSVLPLPHASSTASPVSVWSAVLLLHDDDGSSWHASPAAVSLHAPAATSAAAMPLPVQSVPLHASSPAAAALPVRSAVPLHAASPAAAVPLSLLHDGASRSLWHAASATPSSAADDEPVLPDASDAPDAPALGQVSSNGHVVMKST